MCSEKMMKEIEDYEYLLENNIKINIGLTKD
jgi:hypothetical protein